MGLRIRALVHIAGANFAFAPGDETDHFTDAEALRLVAKNAAVMVDAAKPIETAVAFVPAIEARVDDPAPSHVKHRKGKK